MNTQARSPSQIGSKPYRCARRSHFALPPPMPLRDPTPGPRSPGPPAPRAEQRQFLGSRMGFRDREDAVLALEMPDCAENLLAMTLSLDVSGQASLSPLGPSRRGFKAFQRLERAR
jgi:hypothetical protein